MTSFQPCERCGTMLPRDSTDGLCPVCLVRLVTGEGEPATPAALEKSTAPATPRIGSRVRDYVLEAPLGEGGMGIVYRARQLSLNRVVALKMLPFGRFSPDAHLQRFRAEAEAIARLRHPNIVTIYEVGEHDGQPFFSMEYVDGSDLAKMIRERPLPLRQAARLLACVARAIHHAHEHGIVHRDLKPSNILIDGTGEPHVSDFGLARNLASDSDLTMTGQALGSPHYIPPEQAEGRREAHTAVSDVYGLGAILYHLLVGRPPFVGESVPAVLRQLAEAEPVPPRLLNPDVPRDLETICLKCLEKDPTRRYGTARELAEELERFLRDEPIRARPIGPLERGWRWCRRRPALAAMTAVTLVTLCAGLATSLTLWHRAQERAHQATESLLRAELQRAEDLFERGDSPEALAHLARLLRTHPENHVIAQRIVSALTHRNFLLPASPEFEDAHQGRFSTLAVAADRLISATDGGLKLVVWDTSDGLKPTGDLTLSSPARATAINRDNSRLAVASTDNQVQFWTFGASLNLVASAKLSGPPVAIQFDPLGSRLLAIIQGQGIELLDADTGKLLRTLSGPHYAEFSANGRWLVTVSRSEAVIRDAQTWEPAGQTNRHAYRIETARFSPDATRLVTASADTSARVWEVPSGRRVGRPLFHQEQLMDAVFSPDSRRILTETLSAQGQLWDAVSGLPLSIGFPQWRELDPALFSPDGLWLLSHDQGRVWLRDAFTGKAVSEPVRLPALASVVRFLPHGQRFVTTGHGGRARARLWSLRPGDAAPFAFQHSTELVWAGFSPDGSRILTCSKDRTARIWSATAGAPLTEPLSHERRLTCGAFDSAGARVATADFDGRVRIWNAASGRLIAGPLQHEKEVTALAFSPDDQWLVSASQDGTARFWQAADGAVGPVFQHEGGVRAILFNADGSQLATAGDDRAVRVWAVAIGARVAEFKHAGAVNCVAFSPDGRTLAAGDQTGQVRFWDVTTGYESGAPVVHAGQVFSVCFRRDGRVLVTGSGDQTARVWDVQTRRAFSRPLAHRNGVASASFSPDGRHVLTASFDHTARVWDMATGHPICDALMHGNRVVGAEWSPDGRSVLTASWDGSARVWAMPLLQQAPDSRWLADTAEAVAGLKLAHDEIRQEMTPNALEALRSRQRAAIGDARFIEWSQWLFAERQTRPMAPGLRMSAAEYVRARLDDTRADRVREKLRFTPMNGVALAHWSRLVLQQNWERNPRWLAESTFAAELAIKLAPDSHEPWWSLAEVKLHARQGEAAREAFLRMRERLPKELSAKDGAELESLRHRLNVDDASIDPPKK